MNLVSKKNSRALLYYSFMICIVLAIKVERETIAIAEKAKKDIRKAQVIEDKQRKEIAAQERALQHQVEKDLKAIVVAKKLAVKETKKKQLELLKKNKKKPLIVVLLYKKASDCSMKAITLAEKIDVVAEEERSKMTQTRTRKINLPTRYKI